MRVNTTPGSAKKVGPQYLAAVIPRYKESTGRYFLAHESSDEQAADGHFAIDGPTTLSEGDRSTLRIDIGDETDGYETAAIGPALTPDTDVIVGIFGVDGHTKPMRLNVPKKLEGKQVTLSVGDV